MNISKVFIFTAITLLHTSCGMEPPKVGQIRSSYPEAPGFVRPDASLSLVKDVKESVSFSGSLILWDETLEVSRLKKFLDLSSSSKEIEIALKEQDLIDYDLYDRASSIEKNDLKKIEEQIKRLPDDTLFDFYKTQSKTLLSESVEWFHEQFDRSNHQQVRRDQFCDAALLKFASSDFLLKRLFKSRPTPLAVCEENYRERGFFTAGECLGSGDNGDFFPCFWGRSGIQLSDFKISIKEGSKSLKLAAKHRVDEMFQEINSEEFRENADDYLSSAAKGLITTKEAKYILKLGRLSVSKVLNEKINKLRGITDYMSELNEGTSTSIKYTPADVLHNLHLLIGSVSYFSMDHLEKINNLRGIDKRLSGEERPNLDSELSRELTSTKDQLQNKINKLKSKRMDLKNIRSELNNKWVQKKKEAALYLDTSKIASSLWPNLDLEVKSEGNVKRLRLQLDNQKLTPPITASINHNTGEKSYVNWPSPDNLNVDWDEHTGEVRIKAELSDLKQIGMIPFEKSEKDEFAYHRLATEDGNHVYLVDIYLSPRTVGYGLRTYTGKVAIKKSGEDKTLPVALGSIYLSEKSSPRAEPGD